MAQDENRQGEVKYLADKQKDHYLKPPHQKHSHEKKLQVASEALTPGASASAVARRHSRIWCFSWIRMYDNGCLLSPSGRDMERELRRRLLSAFARGVLK